MIYTGNLIFTITNILDPLKITCCILEWHVLNEEKNERERVEVSHHAIKKNGWHLNPNALKSFHRKLQKHKTDIIWNTHINHNRSIYLMAKMYGNFFYKVAEVIPWKKITKVYYFCSFYPLNVKICFQFKAV